MGEVAFCACNEFILSGASLVQYCAKVLHLKSQRGRDKPRSVNINWWLDCYRVESEEYRVQLFPIFDCLATSPIDPSGPWLQLSE